MNEADISAKLAIQPTNLPREPWQKPSVEVLSVRQTAANSGNNAGSDGAGPTSTRIS